MKKLKEIFDAIFRRRRNRNNNANIQNNDNMDVLNNIPDLDQAFTNRQNPNLYLSTRTDLTRNSMLMPSAPAASSNREEALDPTNIENRDNIHAALWEVEQGGEDMMKVKRELLKEEGKNFFFRNAAKVKDLKAQKTELEQKNNDGEIADFVVVRNETNEKIKAHNPEMRDNIDFSQMNRDILEDKVNVHKKPKIESDAHRLERLQGEALANLDTNHKDNIPLKRQLGKGRYDGLMEPTGGTSTGLLSVRSDSTLSRASKTSKKSTESKPNKKNQQRRF